LRKKGFPIPKLLYTFHGKPFAHVDNECYQVNEWIQGNTYHPGELTREGAYSMGNLLGRFHSFCADNKSAREIQLPTPSEGIRCCKDMLERYKPYEREFADVAKAVLSEQIAILEALLDNFLFPWLQQTNRRMEHWEKIAITWHTQIPKRYYQWQELKERVLEFI